MRTKKEKGPKTIDVPTSDSSADERYDFAVKSAAMVIEFYQDETKKYAALNMIFTIVTLVGSALTPLLILIVPKDKGSRDFWVALPSALACLAAALNSALRFKDEWANSYFTLSAVSNERDRLVARSSPEYSNDKDISLIADNFFNRVGSFVMSEVTIWRQAMTHAEKQQPTNRR